MKYWCIVLKMSRIKPSQLQQDNNELKLKALTDMPQKKFPKNNPDNL